MSNKLKYIIFFGAVFGLLGFAHSYIQFDGWNISIRDKETPAIGGAVGWLILCTALFYFAEAGRKNMASIIRFAPENQAAPALVFALAFTALQHGFLYINLDLFETAVSLVFFCLFYYGLGKAVDG